MVICASTIVTFGNYEFLENFFYIIFAKRLPKMIAVTLLCDWLN